MKFCNHHAERSPQGRQCFCWDFRRTRDASNYFPAKIWIQTKNLYVLARVKMLRLHHFKLELKFLTAADVAQVELPKLTRETEAGPMLVEICN